jgi:TRAP-type C4-dicarboxylate transport system substrate-binding protein
MNKRICYSLALLALVWNAAADAMTLKIAPLAPAGTTWMNEMRAGADAIAQRTDGRVEFKFYPGGVMGNNQSVHRKIRIGQLQGGAFTPGALSEADSSIQLLSLPMLFRSLDEVDYVRQRMDEVLKQRMSSSGFVVLGISEGGFARILSREPMQDLESLRAGKVWIPEGDKISLNVFKALGITPVSLPIADVFTGLQTGLIDTVAVVPTGAIAFQWHTSTGYMTEVPLSYVIGILAVSEKEFSRLSPQDQAIVREEMGGVFSRMDNLNRNDNEAALAALESHGITFLPPRDGEIERWETIASQAIDEMVGSGLIDAGLVAQVREFLESFRARQ